MPALLGDLHELVACDSAGFFWVDEAGEMSNLYAERLLPPDLMREYFRRFYDDRERGFQKGFQRLAQQGSVVSSGSFDEAFYRSEYYNVILRHLDAHYLLYAVIREAAGALGQLSLYRPRGSAPFSAAERECLAGVLRYIAHGLRPGPDAAAARCERDDSSSAVAIMDRQGRAVHLSPGAERMLFLASHGKISRAAMAREEGDVPQVLRDLCRRIDKVFHGADSAPPLARIDNAWGSFVFRAFPLADAAGMPDGLLAVMLHHREPLSLALMRAMKKTSLSTKQREVMLLLAEGGSQQQIAQRMGVSQNTATYHVRQLYTKLDAHDRGEAISRLLAGDSKGESSLARGRAGPPSH